MQQLDLRRIKFLSFKLFKIFENFKTTFRSYYLTLAPYFISNQCSLLVPGNGSIEEKLGPKTFRYFSFLHKKSEEMSIYLEDDFFTFPSKQCITPIIKKA